MKFSTFYHFSLMFKHIKYVIYGCEVPLEVELSLYLKLRLKLNYVEEKGVQNKLIS